MTSVLHGSDSTGAETGANASPSGLFATREDLLIVVTGTAITAAVLYDVYRKHRQGSGTA